MNESSLKSDIVYLIIALLGETCANILLILFNCFSYSLTPTLNVILLSGMIVLSLLAITGMFICIFKILKKNSLPPKIDLDVVNKLEDGKKV